MALIRKNIKVERTLTARQFEVARKAHSEIMKIRMKGENNIMYGKKHTEKTRKQMTATRLANPRVLKENTRKNCLKQTKERRIVCMVNLVKKVQDLGYLIQKKLRKKYQKLERLYQYKFVHTVVKNQTTVVI